MITMVHKLTVMSDPSVLKRHWGSESETYTGGDSLFTALNQGWQIAETVLCQEFSLSRRKTSYVYHFCLIKDGQLVRMSIVSNPRVQSFIKQALLEVAMLEGAAD